MYRKLFWIPSSSGVLGINEHASNDPLFRGTLLTSLNAVIRVACFQCLTSPVSHSTELFPRSPERSRARHSWSPAVLLGRGGGAGRGWGRGRARAGLRPGLGPQPAPSLALLLPGSSPAPGRFVPVPVLVLVPPCPAPASPGRPGLSRPGLPHPRRRARPGFLS